MSADHILYDVRDHVAILTLNRPDKLNAFTREMCNDLIAGLDRADRDDDVRIVIITGAGRAFSAGADLNAGSSQFSRSTGKGNRHAAVDAKTDWSDAAIRDFGGLLTLRMFEMNKPTVCAINGPAAGMGLTLTLAADFRLAAEGAKLALPFVRRAIAPESASAWFLPRIVGISRALDWMLTGRTFTSEEAFAAGLVRSLHPSDEVLDAARNLADEIAREAAPVSVALTRHLLWRMLGADHPMEAHRIESRAVYARGRAADIVEGVASFKERRSPNFADRVSKDMPDFFPWWEPREYD